VRLGSVLGPLACPRNIMLERRAALSPLNRARGASFSRSPRLAMIGMTTHRFPAPWRADKMLGGYVVRDANGRGQS
jgi:hypothetical protein